MLLNAGPGAYGTPVLKLSSFVLSKGITGIRFTEHQRCFIRTQTRSLPTATEAVTEDAALPVHTPTPHPRPSRKSSACLSRPISLSVKN